MPPPPPKSPPAKGATPKPVSTAPGKKETPVKVADARTIPESGAGSVYIEKGVTKNLGDYNSVRITIGMTLPLDYTPEHIAAAKATVEVLNEIIDTEMENQVAMVDAAGK